MSTSPPLHEVQFDEQNEKDLKKLKVWLDGLEALFNNISVCRRNILTGKSQGSQKIYKGCEKSAECIIQCIELFFDGQLTQFGDDLDIAEATKSDEEFIVADEEVTESDYEPSESEEEFVPSEEDEEEVEDDDE